MNLMLTETDRDKLVASLQAAINLLHGLGATPDNSEDMLTMYQAQCLDNIMSFRGKFPATQWILPSYVMAFIQTECDWKPRPSTDGLGSLGPMQVLPSTAADVANHYGVMLPDQSVSSTSILTGMLYVEMLRVYLQPTYGAQPPMDLIVQAYNEGAGNVLKGKTVPAYLAKWKAAQKQFSFVDANKDAVFGGVSAAPEAGGNGPVIVVDEIKGHDRTTGRSLRFIASAVSVGALAVISGVATSFISGCSITDKRQQIAAHAELPSDFWIKNPPAFYFEPTASGLRTVPVRR